MTNTENEDKKIYIRAAGVMIKDDKVLLQKPEIDDLWCLPGGSVEHMERSEDTLEREFFEESGIKIKIERLLWVVENFFEYDEKKAHEVGLYYLVKPIDSEEKVQMKEFIGKEEFYHPEKHGTFELLFRWFTKEELKNIRLLPKFLPEALQNIPEYTEHIYTTG